MARRTWARFGLAIATWAAVGCDRRGRAPAPPPATAPTRATSTPPAPLAEPVVADTYVAGTYKAEMRNPQTGEPFSTAVLTLNADGSMALTNKFARTADGLPPVENAATGRYAVDGSKVTLTLVVGNGKPVPADSPQRVMTFDRSADGARLSNDTGVPPFVRQPGP